MMGNKERIFERMTVTLPPDLERELEAEVAAGRLKSVEAFVTSAVRAQLASLTDLRQSLDEAEDDYRRNGGIRWEEVKARIASRFSNGD